MVYLRAFSDISELTETSFFFNELGLRIELVSTPDSILSIQMSKPIIIASTRPQVWRDVIGKLEKQSVIFMLLGNETYTPEVYNSLNDLKAIKHVFVYNPPTFIEKAAHFSSLVGTIIDVNGSDYLRQIRLGLRDFKTSFHLAGKFRSAKIRYSWSRLPQGYSNSFFYGLLDYGVLSANRFQKPGQSLIEMARLNEFMEHRSSKGVFFFMGQETNYRRRQIVSLLNSRHDAKVIVKAGGFGGTNFDGDLRYIDGIFSYTYNVIAPGYFNNFNHRYTESAIVGSIPAILAHNSIDMSVNSNWTRKLNVFTAHSMRLLLRNLQYLSDRERQLLLSSIRELDFKEIDEFKRVFQEETF